MTAGLVLRQRNNGCTTCPEAGRDCVTAAAEFVMQVTTHETNTMRKSHVHGRVSVDVLLVGHVARGVGRA